MKICVFACVWQRHQILEIFAMGVRRLQESFNIEPITIVSTDADYKICQRLKLNPFMAPNSPLGKKHNLGMEEAVKRGFDRLLIMGSDDLISTEGLEMLLNADRGHVGFRKMYAVNTECDQSIYFEYEKDTRIIGAGRLLTREAIISASNRAKFIPSKRDNRRFYSGEYMLSAVSASHLERRGHGIKKSSVSGLWEDSLQRNLDNSSDVHLTMCGFPPYCIEDERVNIIDLKNEKVQINYYSSLSLQEPHDQYEVKDWGWFLSHQELRAIRALQK